MDDQPSQDLRHAEPDQTADAVSVLEAPYRIDERLQALIRLLL